MRNLINTFMLVVFASVLQSCITSAYDEKLNEGYLLSAIDVKEDMIVAYQDGDYAIGIIEATVFAIGQNDEFIIAKQHPKSSQNEIDKTIINYFIIPLKNKVNKSPDKNLYGPLTKEEFEKKRRELNIEKLDFSIMFTELE